MKRLITLSCIVLAVQLATPASAQVVLNELYSDPGASNHEFFELYNTSIATTPISMDDYTVVSYYENGLQEKGFYVLDLPDLKVGPKGYFVGAAQAPFNFQGNNNSTAANFSWNDPILINNYGSLKKYVITGDRNTPDDQKTYVAGAAPANLNDLFYKRTGNGATYATFVYQNGKLVNTFFGGTGGNTSTPAFVTRMAPLTVPIVTENKSFIINY